MLIIDAKNVNPLSAFYQIRKSLKQLKGVNSTSIFRRKNGYSIIHNLRKYEEYLDSIYRYSYHAKTKSKNKVPVNFKRAFGSSPIKDKYFYIYEDIMKPKIVLARKNESLNFIITDDKDEQHINFRYQECRKSTHCFHMQDRRTSENIGFLGLDIETDEFEDEVHLFINVESVYLKPEFRGKKYSPLFINELSNFVSKAMSDCKLRLTVDQRLYVVNATSFLTCDSDTFVSMVEDAITELCARHDLKMM